jgi:tetratricopeptide (TPR) repeat protein
MKTFSKIYIFIAIVFGFDAFAQNPQEDFTQANKLYQNQDYEGAIEIYESLVYKNYISSDLYYNTANTYYKLNKIAPAILFYKKALKHDPNNEDALFNLNMAEARIADKFEVLPKTFIQELWEGITQMFSINTWAIFGVISSFLSLIFLLWFKFSTSTVNKRLSFVLGLSFVISTIATISIAFQQKSFMENNRSAVVMAANSYVKVAPNEKSEDAFILHEGSSIIVIDDLDDWYRIKLIDGKLGWISADDIAFV